MRPSSFSAGARASSAAGRAAAGFFLLVFLGIAWGGAACGAHALGGPSRDFAGRASPLARLFFRVLKSPSTQMRQMPHLLWFFF
jgi:hypothetical protein